MENSRSIRLHLSIPADEYKKIYRGTIRSVYALTREGMSVRFPVSILQPYLMHNGVHGEFEIYFDEQNKFQKIIKV